MKDPVVIQSVVDAGIECGYRLIDTAAIYRNERYIGDALKQICPKHNLSPEDLFITSKLAPQDQGYDKAMAAFECSLDNLGLPGLGLYLIHWPGTSGLKKEDPQNAHLREGSWKALEELHRNGKVKSIGVSNYTVRHLKEMEKYAKIMPHVLQSECHPALPQHEVRMHCKVHDIFFQAYTSLGQGELIKNDSVIATSANYKKTPAQLLLKWAVQQGLGVIPKASTVDRICENCKIFDFELSEDDLARMTSFFKVPHHYCWDPTDIA